MADISEKRWYVLYTRSRHEKFIDAELGRRQIESFLPLRKIKRKWSDRTMTIEEPMFKSYLFVKPDLTQIPSVLNTKGVVRLVSSHGRPVALHEEIIGSLRWIVQNEIAADPFPYMAVGDRVCVRNGIFKGLEGFVVRKDAKKCRIVISIEAIMASVSVEVDSYLVEKV